MSVNLPNIEDFDLNLLKDYTKTELSHINKFRRRNIDIDRITNQTVCSIINSLGQYKDNTKISILRTVKHLNPSITVTMKMCKWKQTPKPKLNEKTLQGILKILTFVFENSPTNNSDCDTFLAVLFITFSNITVNFISRASYQLKKIPNGYNIILRNGATAFTEYDLVPFVRKLEILKSDPVITTSTTTINKKLHKLYLQLTGYTATSFGLRSFKYLNIEALAANFPDKRNVPQKVAQVL